MAIRKQAIGVALLALTGVAACQAPVQPDLTGAGFDAEQVYRHTCLVCHEGTGAGTMLLDLTTLSQINGGQFPAHQVMDIIDGRADVRAHGSPMPAWGTHYSQDQIIDLTNYLASIQQ